MPNLQLLLSVCVSTGKCTGLRPLPVGMVGGLEAHRTLELLTAVDLTSNAMSRGSVDRYQMLEDCAVKGLSETGPRGLKLSCDVREGRFLGRFRTFIVCGLLPAGAAFICGVCLSYDSDCYLACLLSSLLSDVFIRKVCFL